MLYFLFLLLLDFVS